MELIEISVVSVPANQNTLFSLSKAFDDAEEYKKFKEQFAKEESAKGLETSKPAESESHKEWDMDPKELQERRQEASNLCLRTLYSTFHRDREVSQRRHISPHLANLCKFHTFSHSFLAPTH